MPQPPNTCLVLAIFCVIKFQLLTEKKHKCHGGKSHANSQSHTTEQNSKLLATRSISLHLMKKVVRVGRKVITLSACDADLRM